MDDASRNRWRRFHARLAERSLGEKLDSTGQWRARPDPFFAEVMQMIEEMIGQIVQLEAELVEAKSALRTGGVGSSSVCGAAGGDYAEAMARHEKLRGFPS